MTMNEGINAYYEHVTGSGGKVYGDPPKYAYANYPPVFFHLIGWLGSLTGDVNVTGRWVSLLAYLAIAVFAALIVHRLGNSRRLGAYAGLCWLIWLCAFDPGRVGYNDMHVLGVAVSIAGLYCFVRHPDTNALVVRVGGPVRPQPVHQTEPVRIPGRGRPATVAGPAKASRDLARHGAGSLLHPTAAHPGGGRQVLSSLISCFPACITRRTSSTA